MLIIKRLSVVFTFLFFSVLYCFEPPSDAEAQLGTFEIGSFSEHSIRAFWKSYAQAYVISKEDSFNGDYCAEVRKGRMYTIAGEFIPGDTVIISYSYKASDISLSTKDYHRAFGLWVYESFETAQAMSSKGYSAKLSVTLPFELDGSWRRTNYVLETTEAHKFLVFAFDNQDSEGLLYLDDLEIKVRENTKKRLLFEFRAKNRPVTELPPFLTDFTYFPKDDKLHPFTAYEVPGSIGEMQSFGGVSRPDLDAVVKLSDAELIALLQTQGSVTYNQCNNCYKMAQGYYWKWSVRDPWKITCPVCGQVIDTENFTGTGYDIVVPPSGKELKYYYTMGTNGRKFYYRAGRDFQSMLFFEKCAWYLGALYHGTRDEKYAEKASVILCNYAKYYPDFPYKYDMPQGTAFFSNEPALPIYHSYSRWDYWMYMDISLFLIKAYDLIYHSTSLREVLKTYGFERKKNIENGFFREAAEGVFKNMNYKSLNNMSPTMWVRMFVCGRVVGSPDYIHFAVSQINKYFKENFYFDGFYNEPTVSYHVQGGDIMHHLVPAIGHNDPSGYISRFGLSKISNLQTNVFGENFVNFRKTTRYLTYPDDYPIPLADTWMDSPWKGWYNAGETASHLLPAAGFASLNSVPNGSQIQYRLYWTAKTGHHHLDTLNMTLFANNTEAFSDMGYTHTAYRSWASSTLAHNVVSVDFRNQNSEQNYHNKGNLMYMDTADQNCQIIDVDGKVANGGNTYRRISFLVAPSGLTDDSTNASLIVDFFLAGGGSTYDYVIHGDQRYEGSIECRTPLGEALKTDTKTCVPESVSKNWTPPKTEMDNSQSAGFYYGFLRDVRRTLPVAGSVTKAVFTGSNNCGVNMYIPESKDIEIFTGKNPTIHQAGTKGDSSKLEKFFRKFVLLRKAKKGEVSFQTVFQPFPSALTVRACTEIQSNIVQITLSDREIVVWHYVPRPVSLTLSGYRVQFHGEYGFFFCKYEGY